MPRPPVLEPETALSPTTSVVPAPTPGSIYIEFPKIHLRIESGADAALLRVVLESLRAMMTLPPKTHIWIAAGVTDMRRGFDGLSALVQTKLEQTPFSGHVFVFRGRRGDLIKVLWWDGDGLCLFAKRLERGRFVWPQASDGSGFTQSSSAIDAAGRYRLAASRAHRRAAVSDLSSLCRFAQIFVLTLFASRRVAGILRL